MKKKIGARKTKSNRTSKLDRRAFSILPGFDDSDDKRYWLSQTPQARVRHIEELRRMNYGDRATERLEVVEREKDS
jgi:hypothetical protein